MALKTRKGAQPARPWNMEIGLSYLSFFFGFLVSFLRSMPLAIEILPSIQEYNFFPQATFPR